MDQQSKNCFALAFLSAVSVGLVVGHVSDSINQQIFWKTMLPNTPMPQALLDALTESDNAECTDCTTTLSQKVDEYGYEPPSPTRLLHQDIATSVFFLERNLMPGTKMNIHFTSKMQGARFLSSPVAKKLPSLTTSNLPQLLELFSVSPDSNTADVMKQTIVRCEHPNSINGRVQFCATSLEKLVTLVTSELGNTGNIKAVSMPAIHTDALAPYTIMNVRQIGEERSMIACHKLSFPVGVYYCHQPRAAVAYAVDLVGQDGVMHHTYAMCHRHTSDWSSEYIAFKTLGVPPGTAVCHFNQLDNVIWYRG